MLSNQLPRWVRSLLLGPAPQPQHPTLRLPFSPPPLSWGLRLARQTHLPLPPIGWSGPARAGSRPSSPLSEPGRTSPLQFSPRVSVRHRIDCSWSALCTRLPPATPSPLRQEPRRLAAATTHAHLPTLFPLPVRGSPRAQSRAAVAAVAAFSRGARALLPSRPLQSQAVAAAASPSGARALWLRLAVRCCSSPRGARLGAVIPLQQSPRQARAVARGRAHSGAAAAGRRRRRHRAQGRERGRSALPLVPAPPPSLPAPRPEGEPRRGGRRRRRREPAREGPPGPPPPEPPLPQPPPDE